LNQTIILGAGADSLVAARVLARAGISVLVLESGRVETESRDTGWVAPEIVRAAGLAPSLLKLERADPWASAPLPEGGRLDLWQDMTRSVEAIRKLSERDAARWPAFCERMAPLARFLETLYLQAPPDLLGRSLRDLIQLGGAGIRFHRLGREGIEDLLRFATMPVSDLLDEWFENDVLKGVLGAAGIVSLCQGPRSGGTAFRFLHHHVGNQPGVFRPPLSNLRAALAAAPGIEIRRGADAARITVREGRVAGVVLGNGEELPATRVVSGADAKRTLLALADPAWIDPELARTVRNIRSRGVVARIALALERSPHSPTLIIAPSLDYLERAYDEAKYGNISRAPYLEARLSPSANGSCSVEAQVQYAPYALADSISDEMQRARLGRLALETLSSQVPDLGPAAVENVLSPRDLEERYGYPEGQAEQAEPAPDQLLWMRPVPELAHYRTPIAGLYLCGPGMHPAGGIPGAAGYNAARELLKDLKSR